MMENQAQLSIFTSKRTRSMATDFFKQLERLRSLRNLSKVFSRSYWWYAVRSHHSLCIFRNFRFQRDKNIVESNSQKMDVQEDIPVVSSYCLQRGHYIKATQAIPLRNWRIEILSSVSCILSSRICKRPMKTILLSSIFQFLSTDSCF